MIQLSLKFYWLFKIKHSHKQLTEWKPSRNLIYCTPYLLQKLFTFSGNKFGQKEPKDETSSEHTKVTDYHYTPTHYPRSRSDGIPYRRDTHNFPIRWTISWRFATDLMRCPAADGVLFGQLLPLSVPLCERVIVVFRFLVFAFASWQCPFYLCPRRCLFSIRVFCMKTKEKGNAVFFSIFLAFPSFFREKTIFQPRTCIGNLHGTKERNQISHKRQIFCNYI